MFPFVSLLVELVSSFGTCAGRTNILHSWGSFVPGWCYMSPTWCEITLVSGYPWGCYRDISRVDGVGWAITCRSSCLGVRFNTQFTRTWTLNFDVLAGIDISVVVGSVGSWTVGQISCYFNTGPVGWQVLPSALDHANIIAISVDVSTKIGAIGLDIRLGASLLLSFGGTDIGMDRPVLGTDNSNLFWTLILPE